jgi:2,3-bisphosphoglycerate-independent phosphoglycerate mutase
MKKVLLIILDGFGYREEVHGNAVKLANMKFYNKLLKEYPNTLLEASGEAVGLPSNQFGNSEVGHMTIGAGRVIKSKLSIINENMKKVNIPITDTMHLMGLISDGGVHSHIHYFKDMIDLLIKKGVKQIYFHAITDGRDTNVNVGSKFYREINNYLEDKNIGSVVSVSGRYYAMDRDKNYDRTHLYVETIRGEASNIDGSLYISNSYKEGNYDEFIKPVLLNENGKIKKGDNLLWLNFRPDRAVQVLSELKNFCNVTTLFKVPGVEVNHLFEDEELNIYSLGEHIANAGLTQARIAETEKYAHVTYYFDGGKKITLEGCEYDLAPSPKVETYDLLPEMSSYQIKDNIIRRMNEGINFILANFASPDMVGHTGSLDSTIKALEVVDKCLEEIYKNKKDYTIFLTADHGNSDYMLDNFNNEVTTHSMSKVPLIVSDKRVKLSKGSLKDLSPTILEYMGVKKMITSTGKNLISYE